MIKPFGNQILVKPHEEQEILITEKKYLCEYGEVLAVGSEVKEIKVGDVIGYTIWGVNSLEINGEKHYFVPEDPRFLLGTLEMR